MKPTWMLMRRLAPGVLVAGAALAAVFRFDHAFTTDSSDRQTAGGPAPSASPTLSTPASKPSASPTSPPSTVRRVASCNSPRTVTGPPFGTGFGPVRVEAKVDGDRLCSVRAVTYPVADPMSRRINERAIPQLDASATAHGVEFDTITGATYTVEAYRSSLQAIIDQL